MGGELFLWREGFGPDGPQSPAKGESLRVCVWDGRGRLLTYLSWRDGRLQPVINVVHCK